MDRKDIIRQCFSPQSKLIEIGGSYNPIIPKSQGWATTTIDHADQATLQRKYASDQELQEHFAGAQTNNIEAVDYVWTEGTLDNLIPQADHGTFDGVIASHVGEHMPDPIGFLLAMDKILAPTGIIVLALPDLRVCFDFFRPHSTTGELLDARGRIRHHPGRVFDTLAYQVHRNGVGGWAHDDGQNSELVLVHDFNDAYRLYQEVRQRTAHEDYDDAHGWCFTPTSFHLNIVELFSLGVIPWMISRIIPADGVEFYVWLERRSLRLPYENLQALRLTLMQDMIAERKEQMKSLHLEQRPGNAPVVPMETPSTFSVTAIIPLYNGARFIKRSMTSIINQTVKPKELFVVNDGSTDEGAAVVEAFIANTNLQGIDVRLFHKPNGGQSSARNFGVNHATGDLIGFLDQDDEWYPRHIEKLAAPFAKHPLGTLGWVYSNLDHADADGKVIHRNWLPAVGEPHPKTDLYNCLRRDMFILPSAALILRTAFNAVGGFDERLSGYEDDDLFVRLFQSYNNIFLNEPLSKWCIHHESSSYTARMRRSRDYYCHKLLKTFPDDLEARVFFARDLLLPRFLPATIAELYRALASHDPARIKEVYMTVYVLMVKAESTGVNGIMGRFKARVLRRTMELFTADRLHYLYERRRWVTPIGRWLIFSPNKRKQCGYAAIGAMAMLTAFFYWPH